MVVSLEAPNFGAWLVLDVAAEDGVSRAGELLAVRSGMRANDYVLLWSVEWSYDLAGTKLLWDWKGDSFTGYYYFDFVVSGSPPCFRRACRLPRGSPFVSSSINCCD